MLPVCVINLIQSYVTECDRVCFFYESKYLDIVCASKLIDVLNNKCITILCINKYEWTHGHSIIHEKDKYQEFAEYKCRVL